MTLGIDYRTSCILISHYSIMNDIFPVFFWMDSLKNFSFFCNYIITLYSKREDLHPLLKINLIRKLQATLYIIERKLQDSYIKKRIYINDFCIGNSTGKVFDNNRMISSDQIFICNNPIISFNLKTNTKGVRCTYSE